jgi:hypothetical protein
VVVVWGVVVVDVLGDLDVDAITIPATAAVNTAALMPKISGVRLAVGVVTGAGSGGCW